MKSRQTILLGAALLIAAYAILVFCFGYPLVFNVKSGFKQSNGQINAKYDTIKPLAAFDFNKGEWVAFIFVNHNDKNKLSKQVFKGRLLKTKNIELLKQMQQDWCFIYNGGDIASVESYFLLYNDGKRVFDCGIVLDEAIQGIQSTKFGWLKGADFMLKSVSKFQKVSVPLVILW